MRNNINIVFLFEDLLLITVVSSNTKALNKKLYIRLKRLTNLLLFTVKGWENMDKISAFSLTLNDFALRAMVCLSILYNRIDIKIKFGMLNNRSEFIDRAAHVL